MPAKKKPARRKATPYRSQVCPNCEKLATDLQRVLAERDEARRELAEARRGREAWCLKAIETECRAELAEGNLRDLLAGITAPRPSAPAAHQAEVLSRAERQPAPTYGLPGDAPLRNRFSREFRG